MPRSSGTFTAPSSSVHPAVEGTTIDETDFNALVDDIETALTDSVYTSGLGSTDNQLVRTDGTDTKKVQGTGITVDDSNNVSGVAALSATTINVGNADTTLARTGAGDISVEGNAIYRAGGTDVPISDGGTGASTATAAFNALAPTTAQGDIIYHNGTDNVRLAAGTAGQVLQTGGAGANPSWTNAGAGDVTGPASSVDSEIALFSGTGGKTLKRASTTGLLKASSGVLSAASAGTDYYAPSGTDVAIADGGTGASTAAAGARALLEGLGSTQGDILYRNGTEWVALGTGTVGQVLQAGGAGANPSWATVAGTGDVTAASAFGTDNRLLRSDGTGKGAQASAITVDDSGNASGFASIALPTVPFSGMDTAINVGLTASAATNALTIALKGANGSDPSSTNPVYIPFRSATAATGTPDWRSVTSSLSVTIPASQALGTSNNVPFRVWIVALDNSGTVELAVINCLVGGASPTQVYSINEGGVVSTTAIASAPSAAVFYSTTARTSKAVRILGYVEYSSGLATAGTWASAPTTVQVFGPSVKRPGDVVSVVYAKKTDTFTSTSTTMTDITGLSASIVPTSAANPVLASFSVSGAGTAATNSLFLQSMRGSTAIAIGDAASSRSQVSISIAGEDTNTSIVRPVVWSILDAPGTTSSTTYKVQGRCNAAGTFYINRTQSDGDAAATPRVMSGVTLQEIMS